MKKYDILICGAGVGGLALAVALGREGYKVLLVEKQHKEVLVHRGEFLQPRTLEILQQWDVLPTLQAKGALPIQGMRASTARGTFMGMLDYTRLPTRWNHGMTHYYHQIKAALLASAADLVEIRDATCCTDLRFNSQSEVTGAYLSSRANAEPIAADLVVAADGRNSHLRRWVGISSQMYTYPHQLLGLDLEHVTQIAPLMEAYLSRRGVRVLYPMPGEHARLYVQIRPGEFSHIKEQGMAAWSSALLKETPALAPIADHIPADFASAQLQGAWNFTAPLWVRYRLALIGDAAHYVHPAAGQGMNAAILDAWTLANALHKAQGQVPNALQAYASQRPFEFALVSRLCHAMAMCCTSTTLVLSTWLHWCMWSNRHNQRMQAIATYNMSGLGYRRFTLLDRLHQMTLVPDIHASTEDIAK